MRFGLISLNHDVRFLVHCIFLRLGGIGKQIGDFFFVDGCENVGLKRIVFSRCIARLSVVAVIFIIVNGLVGAPFNNKTTLLYGLLSIV